MMGSIAVITNLNMLNKSWLFLCNHEIAYNVLTAEKRGNAERPLSAPSACSAVKFPDSNRFCGFQKMLMWWAFSFFAPLRHSAFAFLLPNLTQRRKGAKTQRQEVRS